MACASALLFWCKSRTTHSYHIRKLEAFHIRCLQSALGLTWSDTRTSLLQMEHLSYSVNCTGPATSSVCQICSGGAKGWPNGACAPSVNPWLRGCAPAVKPSSFRSVMQQQFLRFTVQHFTTTEANFLALKAPKDRILKAFYQNFPEVTPPEPICGTGQKHPVVGTRNIVPPQKICCPTCAPARINSWRRHWVRYDTIEEFNVDSKAEYSA